MYIYYEKFKNVMQQTEKEALPWLQFSAIHCVYVLFVCPDRLSTCVYICLSYEATTHYRFTLPSYQSLPVSS